MERFLRIQRLIGDQGLQQLQQSRVTVVGLGAVGGYAVEALARAGVGSLRLVDFDTVQPTNLNRQILALESTLGLPKAEAARLRVADINPGCQVEAMQLFAREETLEQILEPKPDMLIDAIDSLNPKIQLLTGAYHRLIPTISSMGAALRTDPSKVEVADIFASRNCPLAKRCRKFLRRNGVGEGITCVFSTEKVEYEYGPPEPSEDLSLSHTGASGRQRRVLGSLPTVTGIFGLVLANQVILHLAGYPNNP